MNSPVFLDTACFIYLFEQHPKYHDAIKPVFSFLSSGKITAFTSIITVTEVLTKPYQNKADNLVNLYLEAFANIPGLKLVGPVYETAIRAAMLRAKYNLNLPDAYQLVMAIEAKCQTFLTNDKNLKKVKEIKIALLEEIK